MNKFGVAPLCPAYGRVYNTQKAVKADWQAGKDFCCANGSICSIRDFGAFEQLEVRFGKRLEKATIVQGSEVTEPKFIEE